jgi:hypothetical protein
MRLEIESGLMYYYAAIELQGAFYRCDPFPEDEMPPQERQNELYGIVVDKLAEVGFLRD